MRKNKKSTYEYSKNKILFSSNVFRTAEKYLISNRWRQILKAFVENPNSKALSRPAIFNFLQTQSFVFVHFYLLPIEFDCINLNGFFPVLNTLFLEVVIETRNWSPFSLLPKIINCKCQICNITGQQKLSMQLPANIYQTNRMLKKMKKKKKKVEIKQENKFLCQVRERCVI